MLVKHLFKCLCYNLNKQQFYGGVFMSFYHRLRDIREDKDLKQSDIAEQLQITRQQYQLYESGKRQIPFNLVIDISKFFKVSIDYIAGLTNDKRGLTRSELSAEETEILKKIRSLSNERKYKLLGRLDTYCEEQQEEQALTKEAQ